MLEELKKIFQRKGLMEEAVEASYLMLEDDWAMFKAAVKSLRESDSADVEIDIDSMDIKINKFERDVRKKVLTHLAVHDATDLNIGLILVSIISDIERIGDYTKNIVSLAEIHPGKLELKIPEWEKDIKQLEKTISTNFGVLIKAMKSGDEKSTEKLLDELWKAKKICSKYLGIMLDCDDIDISKSDAVALAIYTRFIKRISSHLMNIASSIVNPFHKIGYRKISKL